MMAGTAGSLILPRWRIPDPVIVLPPYFKRQNHITYALGYQVTRAELTDNLYDILLPGITPYWDEVYKTYARYPQ